MSDSPAAMRIPETMGPQEIGPYFRELREHFKLTPQDVSERLHIRVRYVTAMEEARFEALPGKVYARGYVHTYAEFLGLDADQVVAQCFAAGVTAAAVAEEKPSVAMVAPAKPKPATMHDFKPTPPPLLREKLEKKRGRGRNGMLLLAGIVFALVVSQFLGGDEAGKAAPDDVAAVAEIPDTLLASVRTPVMPTARNFSCLMGNLLLACFYAGDTLQVMQELGSSGAAAHPYLGGIDFEGLTLPEPVAAPAEDAAAAPEQAPAESPAND